MRMCYVMKQVTGFPRERVIGMAGVWIRSDGDPFIARNLSLVKNINAFVLGGHRGHDGSSNALNTVSGSRFRTFFPKG